MRYILHRICHQLPSPVSVKSILLFTVMNGGVLDEKSVTDSIDFPGSSFGWVSKRYTMPLPIMNASQYRSDTNNSGLIPSSVHSNASDVDGIGFRWQSIRQKKSDYIPCGVPRRAKYSSVSGVNLEPGHSSSMSR